MSLLDAWVSPHEAIVAVDTSSVAFDGSTRAYSKILPLPHLNAVLANRGQGQMLNFVWAACLTAQSFDEMLDSMTAEHLGAIEQHLIGDGLFTTAPEKVGHELIAVGFSQRQARMIGKAFVRHPGAAQFTVADFESCVSPWDGASMGHIPRKPANAERLARAQVRWLRSLGPHVAGGGDLIVCRVTRKTIELRHALTFPTEMEAAA